MKLLLDTHFLVWLATEPHRLSAPERAILLESNRIDLLLSVISLWEIRLKWDALDRHGDRKGRLDPAAASRFANAAKIEVYPLTAQTSIAPLLAPIDHPDPFDRLLLVQAQELQVKLFTRDTQLRGHPLAFFS